MPSESTGIGILIYGTVYQFESASMIPKVKKFKLEIKLDSNVYLGQNTFVGTYMRKKG